MDPSTLTSSVGHAAETLRDLPWGVHLLFALALLAGIAMWLAGRRFLQPLTVLLFAILGGICGYLFLPLTPLAETVPAVAGLLLGLFVGTLSGILLYRFALAIGLGLVLAMLGPLIAATVLEMPDPEEEAAPMSVAEQFLRDVPRADADDDPPAPESDRAETETRPEAPDGDAPAASFNGLTQEFISGDDISDAVRTATERIKAFWSALRVELAAKWQELPPAHRWIMSGSALIGLLSGVVVGLALPRWSAGAVTAMFGAAIWLPCAAWLVQATGAPGDEWVRSIPALYWIIIWGVTAFIGACAQWSGLVEFKRSRAGNSANGG